MRKDDNVLPSASEIPSMLSAFRHPRKRRVSVGPQSEADVREYIANREEVRRKRSASSPKRRPTRKAPDVIPAGGGDVPSPLPGDRTGNNISSRGLLQVKTGDQNLLTRPTSDAGASSDSGREDDERKDKAMFSALEKPRTHYDVEVITKLVVYAGESVCSKLAIVHF